MVRVCCNKIDLKNYIRIFDTFPSLRKQMMKKILSNYINISNEILQFNKLLSINLNNLEKLILSNSKLINSLSDLYCKENTDNEINLLNLIIIDRKFQIYIRL